MASGVYDGGSTSVSYIKPRLVWESVPNAGNNTSEVTVTLWARNSASGSGYVDGTGAWQIIIDGQYSGKISKYVKVQAGQDWVEVVSWTTTVSHDADGSREIKIQATGGISSSSPWSSTKCGVEITLDTIGQTGSTATVNSPMAVDGTTRSYVTINAGGNVWHRVKWEFGSLEYETSGATTFAYLTVPTSWLSAIPTATSGVCTITVTTYGDQACTVQIGEPYTLKATFTVPASMVPEVSSGWAEMAPVQTNANAPAGLYIAGISKAKVTFDTSKVTAPAGTTIKGYKITYAGVGYESPYTTPALSAGTASVTATVTDARGRSTSTTLTATVLSYAAPSLSEISVYRSLSNGAESQIGTYAAVKAKANVSGLNGNNGYTLSAQIKQAGGSYGAAHAMSSGVQLFLAGLDTTANYYVLITLEDSLGNRATSETLIAAGEADTGGAGPSFLGMKLIDGGDGAGFGCEPESGYLSVAYTNGMKIVNGKLTIGETAISEAQLQALLSLL